MAVRPSPTGAADPENGETAPGVEAPPQTDAAASVAAPQEQQAQNQEQGHPSADDGRDKVLKLADHHDRFGPVEIAGETNDQGEPVSYTIDRLGVLVKGPHVAKVREAAQYSHVPLVSSFPESNAQN